jgi:16S rRNA (guanine966-N2)-methyltransferase
MRVIAGSLGGRRLSAPPGRATRPTSDRVREALFSMLAAGSEQGLDGVTVLDLFAGTGALGIEALSRGAASAVFFENDRAALRALRSNLDSLGLAEPAAEVRAGDALAGLRAARAGGETYDLMLVDPPYAQAGELGSVLSELLPALLAPGGRVAVESDRRAPLELGLPVVRAKRYGDTTITIHHHVTEDNDEHR